MRAGGRRERGILWAAAALSVAVPLAADRHLDARVRGGLEPALSEALGTSVEVAGFDADLTGAVRLSGVRVGGLFAAGTIEASVGLATLLSGRLRADEVRIDRPQLHARLDATGDSNIERLLRRVAERRGDRGARGSASAGGGLRRVVVTGGDLLIRTGDHGALRLRGLELHPQRGGVRAVAAEVGLSLAAGGLEATGRFDRAAADLTLPGAGPDGARARLRVDRFAAAGGSIALRAVDAPPEAAPALPLRDVVVAGGLHARGGAWLSARVDRDLPGTLDVAIERGADETRVEVRARALPLSPLSSGALVLDDAVATAELVLALGGGGEHVAVELSGALDGVIIDSPRLAPRPVAIDLTGRLRARRDGGQVLVDELELHRGPLALSAHGELAWPSGARLPDRGTVEAALARVDCPAALAALPEPLRDRLEGLQLGGTFAATAALSFDRAASRQTSLALDVDTRRCRVTAEATAADPRRLRRAFEQRFGDGSRAMIGPGHGAYVELGALPAHVVTAIVTSEDARFFRHRGFDPIQIERSVAVNLAEGAMVRGGSTISQQLVKNVFLSAERSFARKLQEAVLTWRLEAHLGKRLILERYLNVIELGEGVYGVGAAARHWFDKPASQLSLREAAFLTALTPAPRTISRRIRAHGGLDAETAARVDLVLRVLRRDRVISEAEYRRALGERLVLVERENVGRTRLVGAGATGAL
jgi:hypothetical protein